MRGIQRPDAKNVDLTEKAVTESVEDKDLIVNWYDWNMYSWNEVISKSYYNSTKINCFQWFLCVSLNYLEYLILLLDINILGDSKQNKYWSKRNNSKREIYT